MESIGKLEADLQHQAVLQSQTEMQRKITAQKADMLATTLQVTIPQLLADAGAIGQQQAAAIGG